MMDNLNQMLVGSQGKREQEDSSQGISFSAQYKFTWRRGGRPH